MRKVLLPLHDIICTKVYPVRSSSLRSTNKRDCGKSPSILNPYKADRQVFSPPGWTGFLVGGLWKVSTSTPQSACTPAGLSGLNAPVSGCTAQSVCTDGDGPLHSLHALSNFQDMNPGREPARDDSTLFELRHFVKAHSRG